MEGGKRRVEMRNKSLPFPPACGYAFGRPRDSISNWVDIRDLLAEEKSSSIFSEKLFKIIFCEKITVTCDVFQRLRISALEHHCWEITSPHDAVHTYSFFYCFQYFPGPVERVFITVIEHWHSGDIKVQIFGIEFKE